ncbi:PEP-CTERM sorting domain-containing protein [Poriferisphaera sp. WC338]|uniref:PEP-CTERM sorting domain-containing protein n=1 Tax=Poriferisphaera sp. WC338 TaxID=3425129 RepID=UPI003D818BCB
MYRKNMQLLNRPAKVGLTAVIAMMLSLVTTSTMQAAIVTSDADTLPTESSAFVLELTVQHRDLSAIWSTSSGIRRNVGISIADYFNDDVYSTTILFADNEDNPIIEDINYNTIAEAYDPVAGRTKLYIQIRKGGFVDWTDGSGVYDEKTGEYDDSNELTQIDEMPDSPLFYSLIARNLNLAWYPPDIDTVELNCRSSVVCTAEDLYNLMNNGNADLAKSELMSISISHITQASDSIPEPASLVLLGLGSLLIFSNRCAERLKAR